MERYKIRPQKNRSGKLINPLVNTKAKASTLEFIRRNFRDAPFTIKEFLDKKLNSWHRDNKNKIAKQTMRVKRLLKNGWLKKPNKEGKFDVSKKYENYKKAWGSFDNPLGPLMKSKDKEKIKKVEEIREVQVEKEVTKLNETKFLGEI